MHRVPGQRLYTRLVAEKLRPNEFPRSAYWLAWDEASLELGYVPEQFVAFVKKWVELVRIDSGRNVSFTRLVTRRDGRG